MSAQEYKNKRRLYNYKMTAYRRLHLTLVFCILGEKQYTISANYGHVVWGQV